jgi:hypothetical protein
MGQKNFFWTNFFCSKNAFFLLIFDQNRPNLGKSKSSKYRESPVSFFFFQILQIRSKFCDQISGMKKLIF